MASSDSRRIVVIIAGIVVLGVGAALYYLLVFQPGRDREAARGQITEWEIHWNTARDCMIGDKPLAADLADAITARELIKGTTDAAMGDCTKSVGGLVRPPGNDTGVTAVEAAWPVLEQAASEVAQAYATHRVQPLGANPLPAALDKLVAAHAALRKAAGMSPPVAIAAPPAPALAPTPLMIDGAQVEDLGAITVDGVVRGHAMVKGKGGYYIKWDGKGVTGTASGPGLRSVPEHTWAVFAAEEEAGGSFLADDDGQIASSKTATLTPLLALGEGPQRIVLYSLDDKLQVARSTDGGVKWTTVPAPTEGQVAFTATPAGDRLDLAWTGRAGLMLLSLSPTANATGPLPAPVTLPAQELATWCTGGALWLVGATARGYLVLPDGKPPGVELVLSEPRPIACNAVRFVMRGGEPGGEVDHSCGATGCTELPSTGDERVIGVVGDHVYRAATRTNVVAVWRDAEPVKFFHLPAPRDLYGIADVGGKPVLLLLDSEQTALEQAPLPL